MTFYFYWFYIKICEYFIKAPDLKPGPSVYGLHQAPVYGWPEFNSNFGSTNILILLGSYLFYTFYTHFTYESIFS